MMKYSSLNIIVILLVAAINISFGSLHPRRLNGLSQSLGRCPWTRYSSRRIALAPRDTFTRNIAQLRGGELQPLADEDEDDEEYHDAIDDEDDGEEDDEYFEEDDEYYQEDEEDEEDTLEVSAETSVAKFDEPLSVSPLMQLYATLGVMMICRKINLYSPFVVRLARFVFIAYVIVLQVFLLYVRMLAKKKNDTTQIIMKSPLSKLVQSQLGDEAGMVKTLASSFLSSQSTVMEYDLRQARNLQGGILFNMIFMWVLHFKMEQVQPLLIQAATGLLNLYFHPLFQAYVLGRNLERPFKTPATMAVDEASQGETDIEITSEGDEEILEQKEDDDEEKDTEPESKDEDDDEDEKETDDSPEDEDAEDDDASS